jgi:DNA polymerase
MVDARRRRMLDAMGVTVWSERDAPLGADREPDAPVVQPEPAAVPATRPEPAGGGRSAPRRAPSPTAPAAPTSEVGALGWPELRLRVAACTACGLHATRTNTVFGVGDEAADWLFVGEAPGADEDAQGEPFVGRAGQLLTSMIAALGLRREQVFIANILKCRPPNNRDPQPDEVGQCLPYLARQVALVQPRIIVCVGRIAAQNLLGVDTPIGKLRGAVHAYRDSGIPVVVTYHPAYLLRSPTEKRKAWEDLKLARRTLEARR